MLTIERAMRDRVTPTSLRHVAESDERTAHKANRKDTKRRLGAQAAHLRTIADRLEVALRVLDDAAITQEAA